LKICLKISSNDKKIDFQTAGLSLADNSALREEDDADRTYNFKTFCRLAVHSTIFALNKVEADPKHRFIIAVSSTLS